MSKVLKKITLIILLITIILGINTIVNADTTSKTPVNIYINCPKCNNSTIYLEGYGENDITCSNKNCLYTGKFNATPSNTAMTEKKYNTNTNMPQNNISGSTGMMPQYYESNGRKVTFPDSRLNLETNQWEATIDGKVIYCAKRGAYVRYGEYDKSEHLLKPGPGNTIIQGKDINFSSNATLANAVDNTVKSKHIVESAQDAISLLGTKYWNEKGELVSASETVYYVPTYGGAVVGDALGVIPQGNNATEMSQNGSLAAIDEMEDIMKYIMQKLGASIWPSKYSSDVDGVYTTGDTITKTLGPKVVVLETDNTKSDGYGDKNLTYSQSYLNNRKAYVLTALENAYSYDTGRCASEYTLNDIQTAYWWLLSEEGHVKPVDKSTGKGYTLYQNSNKYASFTDKVNKDGYEVSINQKNARVIANRTEKSYYVGPFTITYPDMEDISYLKALTIETNSNKTLTYGLDKNEFSIVLDTAKKSNGLNQKFPASGQSFFVKIDADKINDASQIKLGAHFEYISGTEMNYDMLQTKANIYQYIGYTSIKLADLDLGTYYAREGVVTIDLYYLEAEDPRETIKETKHDPAIHSRPGAGAAKDDFSCCNGGITEEKTNTNKTNKTTHYLGRTVASYPAYQPYIKMTEQPVETAIAQDLLVGNEGKRIYKTEYAETKLLDITMELGGYVWVDEEQGKLSEKNGIKDDNEKVVPGVRVILYRANGSKVTETHTDDNGKYLFKGLNAMEKYYVQFVYNGQYYQPTKYVSPTDAVNGWGKGNWRKNSNSTDIREERIAFNEKFASIGDYHFNYSVGDSKRKTFTKEQLINAKIINEFGNLIKTQPENQEQIDMIQYVRDCQISAYTGINKLDSNSYVYDLYPIPNVFTIDGVPVLDKSLLGMNSQELYPDAYYINLGLEAREEADISVKKDVSKVTLEINGKTHEYTYDTLDAASNPNREEEWNIDVRLSDGYYNKQYKRELYKSDYSYDVSVYGDAAKLQELGKSKDDELKVYVTYKIMVGNRSSSLRIRPDELVDYYDKDYTYVADRSYIKLTKQNGREYYTDMYNVKASETSKYAQETQITKDGYKNLYINGLYKNAEKIDEKGKVLETIADGVYLEAGETAYIYLTFEVNKDSNGRVILDEEILTGKEIGVGKENVVEINGYSTQYPKGATVPNVFDKNGNLKDLEGTTPGRVDRDSNPGNLKPEDLTNPEKYEDDTDKAPNIRIRLYRGGNQDRVISGKAWEDERTNKVELTTTGDGIRNEKETLIDGVTVQLVEIMDNGTEFVWRETSTGTKTEETPIINYKDLVSNYKYGENRKGSYAFKSFIPGNYVVRFIYGDTIKTVAPSSLGGLNVKSYNGQDYKSTTYQKGVTQNNSYIVREASKFVNGQEILGDVITIVPTFKSDASNNETLTLNRETLKLHNDAYKNNRVAYLYDVLASNEKTNVSDAKDIASRRSEVTNYSDNNVRNYIAEVLASHKSDYNTMNDRNQLLNDLMQNTKMRAETGLVVVEFEEGIPNSDGTKLDNSYVIDNVDLGLEERPKAQVIMSKEVTNVKLTLADGSILFDANNPSILTPNVVWDAHNDYETGYKNNLLDSNKFASLENIRMQNADKFGFIQLNMDEELMHGATIKISYKMTVQNVGEVDYIDNQYYYTGVKSPNAQVVKTKVEKVIDYVANNLQFYAKDNINWDVIKQEELLSQGLVNEKLKDQVAKYNTVIVTDDFAAELVPALYKEVNKNAQDSISVPLVLTQLISTENEEDDLQYRNIVEIAEISNTAGRRQEYSVVGNQDPTVEPQELDTDRAEVVKILPPFGNTTMYVIIAIITIAAAGIITTGAIFIKKKVLTK